MSRIPTDWCIKSKHCGPQTGFRWVLLERERECHACNGGIVAACGRIMLLKNRHDATFPLRCTLHPDRSGALCAARFHLRRSHHNDRPRMHAQRMIPRHPFRLIIPLVHYGLLAAKRISLRSIRYPPRRDRLEIARAKMFSMRRFDASLNSN